MIRFLLSIAGILALAGIALAQVAPAWPPLQPGTVVTSCTNLVLDGSQANGCTAVMFFGVR